MVNWAWLCARHWYSSLVDLLTDKTDKGKDGAHWTWAPEHKKIQLGIQPLPYSAFANNTERFLAEKEKRPVVALNPVSCWGEWHFVVLNGTENEDLAIEVINHMMSSNAICERAEHCAAVPTVEMFYDRYADVPCLRLPERRDIGLPTMTYQELRDTVFDVAGSRRPIFDYQHCMRELHGVLVLVQQCALTPERLANHVLDAVERIHLLQSQGMLSQ